MFNNQIYPAEIGKAGYKKGDRTIDVRIDVEVPVGDYARLHRDLGELMRFFFMYENSKQYQFAYESKPCDLIFAPMKGDFESGDHVTKLGEIEFEKKLIVVKTTDGESEQVKYLLQLSTTLANTEANREFVGNYYEKNSYCKFIEAQTELDLDSPAMKRVFNTPEAKHIRSEIAAGRMSIETDDKKVDRQSYVDAVTEEVGRAMLKFSSEFESLADLDSFIVERFPKEEDQPLGLRATITDKVKSPSVEIDNLQVTFNKDGGQVYLLEDGFSTGDAMVQLTWPELWTLVKNNPTITLEGEICQKKETKTASA